MKRLSAGNLTAPILLASSLILLTACSGGGGGGSNTPAKKPTPITPEILSHAPLCDEIIDPAYPNKIFTHALVNPDAVDTAVVLGDMEPSSPQEIINFEQGFYISQSGTQMTAPADLHITSIESSLHIDTGLTDYGISFDVCSYQSDLKTLPAVLGNFAHITHLGEDLNTLFESEMNKYKQQQDSAITCNGDGVLQSRTCTLSINRLRDLIDDQKYDFIAYAGSSLGEAGPLEGKAIPRGIDTNLQDKRKNDYAGNYYINPDRLGAEEGPGTGWRYGACFYEYFPEQYSSAYTSKISSLGDYRESKDNPCGVLEVDKNRLGTVGGVWATGDSAGLSMSDDFGGELLDNYLENILVMADHFIVPGEKIMLSTSIDALSDHNGENKAMEFNKAELNDNNWQLLTNLPLDQTEPGYTYCYAGNYYGSFVEFYFLLALSDDTDQLFVQRVDGDCSNTTQAEREMSMDQKEKYLFVR